ncbi:TetR/AcrR family transcriptional regulator [Fervidibacillus albus]|uniref:TetR/AcrR family transcriptional regulator n=1 Tax=Fervidibacillus albus TaxID=2980026 RepID=A0A9E8LU93_9BACI|nr:TetR/AcrR family transcriptional regulator [Fervidibacillus albus]WAA09763.1 TetR/AcrR family transcriptional regulator [Fervidibacillus albus]
MARERKFTTDDLFQKTKQLLLAVGYEGFTIQLLAKELDVTRAAIYKYYENKDELITDYLLYEIDRFMADLKKLDRLENFENQFDFLLRSILKHKEIHRVARMFFLIPIAGNEKVAKNKEKLEKLHNDMYDRLYHFIASGKKVGKIKNHLPDALILGMIFHTISIVNSTSLSDDQWFVAMKEMLVDGIYIRS